MTTILRLLFLLHLISSSQIYAMIYLNNCSFAIQFYQQYLNLLYSSNDFHTIHLQAIYSYPANQSFIPGHIYTYQKQSVALIPLLIRCTYPTSISTFDYLPFTQCSSTITSFLPKRNYEPTRTYFNLRTILSLKDVPLLYTGEYNLLLSNCSFRWNSTVYQLKSNDLFTFHIQYERSITDSSCQSCNQRTSICHEHQCICRGGALPIEIFDKKRFCIDTTSNCSFDPHRCLTSKSLSPSPSSHRSKSILIILIISLSSGSIILLLSLVFWFISRRKTSTHSFHKHHDPPSDQSIYIIHRHERTPSMISMSDSTKCSDLPSNDSSIINEYVSRYDDEYPKIISEQANGDVVFIYA